MSEKQKKSWSYGRLTTDQPDDNMSMSLNLFFAKDGEAWARNCGPEPEFGDIKLTDFDCEAYCVEERNRKVNRLLDRLRGKSQSGGLC